MFQICTLFLTNEEITWFLFLIILYPTDKKSSEVWTANYYLSHALQSSAKNKFTFPWQALELQNFAPLTALGNSRNCGNCSSTELSKACWWGSGVSLLMFSSHRAAMTSHTHRGCVRLGKQAHAWLTVNLLVAMEPYLRQVHLQTYSCVHCKAQWVLEVISQQQSGRAVSIGRFHLLWYISQNQQI